MEFILKFATETATFNSLFGICLYWLPMLICVVGYTIRTARNVQKDKVNRAQAESVPRSEIKNSWDVYSPTDTVGDLIGRALISIIPIGNLWAGLFDVSPELFRKLFKYIGKAFDQPLVPKRRN